MRKILLLTALACAAVRAEIVDGARLPFFPVLPAADIHVLPPEAANSPRRLVPEDLLRHVNNLEIIAADPPVAAAQMDERHGTVIVAGQRQWLRQIAALPLTPVAPPPHDRADYALRLRKDLRPIATIALQKAGDGGWFVFLPPARAAYRLTDPGGTLARLLASPAAPLLPWDEVPVVVSEADKNDAVKNAFSALRDERKPQDYSEAERERMAVARLRLRALYQREIEPGYADIRYQAPDGTFFPLSEEDLRTMDERQTSDCQWREEMAFPCQAEQLIAGKEQAVGGYLQGEREMTLAMLAPYAGGDTVPLLPPDVWQAANQMDTREHAFVKDDIFDRPGAVSMRCFGPLPHLSPWELLRPGLARLKPQTTPVLPPDIAALPMTPLREKLSLTRTDISYGFALFRDGRFIAARALIMHRSGRHWLVIDPVHDRSYYLNDPAQRLRQLFTRDTVVTFR